MTTPSFTDLIAPTTPEDFFRRHWETKHLFVHRKKPDFYESLFDSFRDVDRWLTAAQGLREALVLLVPPKSTNRSVKRMLPRETSPQTLYRAFDSNHTIVLEGIEKAWPPVADLAAELREVLSAGVKINLYMTPPGAQGVAVHPDMQDVLVLQVGGDKEWKIYEPTIELPAEKIHYWRQLNAPYLTSLRSLDQAPLIDEGRLHQGDFLYVPRGVPHEAIAPADTASVHLTVTLHPLLWVDFLKAAAEVAAMESRDLRRSLPPGFLHDEDARRNMAESFPEMLETLARSTSFQTTLDAVLRKRLSAHTAPGDGHFAQLLRLDEITPETRVARRSGFVCLLDVNQETAVLHYGDDRFQGPAALAESLEFIRDQKRFRVSDIPGELDDESRVLLVRRLIRDGLLRMT